MHTEIKVVLMPCMVWKLNLPHLISSLLIPIEKARWRTNMINVYNTPRQTSAQVATVYECQHALSKPKYWNLTLPRTMTKMKLFGQEYFFSTTNNIRQPIKITKNASQQKQKVQDTIILTTYCLLTTIILYKQKVGSNSFSDTKAATYHFQLF